MSQGRTAPLTVRVDYRSLAGVVQYLVQIKDPARTKSEAVGAAVDLCYGTLVATKKIRPVETIEQALAMLEVHGLGPQQRESLGARRTASLVSSEEESEIEFAQVSGVSQSVARKLLAAERSISLGSLSKTTVVESSDEGARTASTVVSSHDSGIPEAPSEELLASMRQRGLLLDKTEMGEEK